MTTVSLNKDFSERIGKYGVSFNNYSDTGIYSVSNEYHDSEYGEDLAVSVVMTTEEGVVSDLNVQVNVINVERISKRRELIAFEVKYNYIISYIDKVKERHNNVLDIDFIREVANFILNCNNFSNVKRYEVVIEDEANVDKEVKVVEDDVETEEDNVVEEDKIDKVSFNKSFEVKINGLAKSYSITTEEIESKYGYTDLLCKIEAKSTILIDENYAVIRAYAEIYDGVVTYVHIGRDNNHLQLESFLDSMTAKGVSRKVDMLVDDIKYELALYAGNKDIDFAYSLLNMVLGINSFDTDTYLYNKVTYNLLDIA